MMILASSLAKPIFTFVDGNYLTLVVVWSLHDFGSSEVNYTLSYGLSEILQYTPIMIQIPRNETKYNLQTPLLGFLFQFNLTAFVNGTTRLYSAKHMKQSGTRFLTHQQCTIIVKESCSCLVCPLAKFGSTCQHNCRCFPLSNVGTCNVKTGQCYCPSLLGKLMFT